MQLKEFSLISPVIEPGEVLTALETAIPPAAIEQAIGYTEAREERNRSLPAHLVVCLVIGMSVWSSASMRTVLKNLVDGLSEAWVRVGQYWKVPCKSSITEARQRVGPASDESVISSGGAPPSHRANSRSLDWWPASGGSRRNRIGCAR